MCKKLLTNIGSKFDHCSPSRSFPILVYFKETQTPQENWDLGPGAQANSPEAIANGAGKVTTIPTAKTQSEVPLNMLFPYFLPLNNIQFPAKYISFPQ